jgi:hypothetical protein
MQLSEFDEERLAKRIAPGIMQYREYNEQSNQNFVYFYSEELLSGNFKKISPRDLVKLRRMGIIKRTVDYDNAQLSEYGVELMRKNGFDVEESPPEPPKPKPIKHVKVSLVFRGQRISEGLKKHYATHSYPIESCAKISEGLRRYHAKRRENPVEIVVVPKQKIEDGEKGRHLSAEHRLHLTKAWREAHKQAVG